jgi:hypothetical protein
MVEYAIGANLKSDAKDFYDLEIIEEFGKTNGKKVRQRLMAIFEYIGDHGYSPRMSPERGNIYGIKWEFSRKQIRLGCFQLGKCWILTHGFFKKGAQKKLGVWSVDHLDRADRIRAEHLANLRTMN